MPRLPTNNPLSGVTPLPVAWLTLAGMLLSVTTTAAVAAAAVPATADVAASAPSPVDASTFRGKVMAGYQGWFRCPGDGDARAVTGDTRPAVAGSRPAAAAAGRTGGGWVHWSRDGRRLAPDTLTFDLWPDLTDYGPGERFAAPGFTHADGRPAELFSSDHPDTVRRHFEWMRDYGFDGAWLQHFVVELPGAPGQGRYPSRLRVLRHVQAAAKAAGRVWALTYDVTGTPGDKVFDTLTNEWKSLVDGGLLDDPRYLRQGGKPVVQVFGFYPDAGPKAMSADTAGRLVDFFKTSGNYQAFVFGGGAWYWRTAKDPAWQAVYRKLDAYAPWNVGNTSAGPDGTRRASVGYWADDQRAFEATGGLWVPVLYPGFSWDHLQRKPAGTTTVPRRGGRFYWEQFVAAARLKPAAAFVAMFDEVDEGTAIFKVTSDPPTQAAFVGYDGLPSDWYLRLTGEGAKALRGERPATAEGELPIRP
jgi:hypothetical protein